MRVKKSNWEFDVWCRNCKTVITVEGPDDLQKEIRDGQEMFCLTCPVCGHEVWFDGICGYSLSPDFIKQVKPRKKDYLEIASENCKKFNEKFEGTFDN